MRVRVKICGITRPEDAVLAVRLGASALGFVFWPESPRAISIEAAQRIAAAVPPFVARVGVFVDATVDEVARVTHAVGLDAVQLHGDEPVAHYGTLKTRVIKAVRLHSEADVTGAAQLPAAVTPLVDASDRARRGGTGKLADWRHAAALAARRPIMLAGGLTADNVVLAIREVRPWAVDVSSGVELSPGVKSADRLTRFFAAVAEADQSGAVGQGPLAPQREGR